MANIYTLRSGATSHPEDSVLQFLTDLVKSSGVLSLSDDHFLVEAQATPDMTVKVKQGRAYLRTSTSNVYPVRSDGDIDVAISSNSSGNDRIDAVVLYVDLGASPNSDASNVAKLTVVEGTPAASPSAPTDAEIQSAIGASNPFLRLANVTVANGATSITDSDISDTRVEVNQASLIKEHLKLEDRSSDPSIPESGYGFFYLKSKQPILLPDTGTKHYFELADGLYRNAIINGNFDIWQRGTSFTAIGLPGNRYGYTADRWWSQAYYGIGGSGDFTFEFSRQEFTPGQTDVPNNPKYFYRFSVSSLATQGSSDGIFRTYQRIEGVHHFAGGKTTLSFWAKADSAREIAVCAKQFFGSGGTPSSSVHFGGQKLNLTTSWQKFTVTFDVPSISGKTLGTNGDDYLEIVFIWYKQDDNVYSSPSGVVGTYATGSFDLAQVQLCAGEVDLPFQPRPIAEEVRLCQRYYEKSYNLGVAPGSAENSYFTLFPSSYGIGDNNYFGTVFFKVRKRTAPTVTLYHSDTGASGYWRPTGGGNVAVSADYISQSSFLVKNVSGSTVTAVHTYGHWVADAEL